MLFLKDVLMNSKGKDWYDGFLWLAWHLICGLMPIWITIILLRVFKQPIEIEVFTSNAEFALYSASFLGTCLYIVLRDFRRNGFPSRGVLSIILVPILFLSGFMYSLVAILNVLNKLNITAPLNNFDKPLLISTTLFLLPLVFIMTFLIIVVDNVRSSTDIRAIQQESYFQLNSDFDEIGEK